MTVLDLSNIKVGDLLIRRSVLTELPVVISEMDEETFSVRLRTEDFEDNLKYMMIGMSHFGVEGSPVQMLKTVVWKYSRITGNEIDPHFDSILLKE